VSGVGEERQRVRRNPVKRLGRDISQIEHRAERERAPEIGCGMNMAGNAVVMRRRSHAKAAGRATPGERCWTATGNANPLTTASSSGELTALAAILILRRFPARCFGGAAWPARRGEESGDDARFRHDGPAEDGGPTRVAGGPATTIVRARPTYPQFYRVYRAGENP